MGDAASELSGKLGLDTTDFKTGISAANRELRVIESGFRASAAALGDWAKDATGLEMRIKSLTSAIDIQDAKVKALAEEHRRVATEQGANSRAAQTLQISLNKETEALNKMQSELNQSKTALDGMGKESTTTGAEVEQLAKKEDTAVKSTEKLKSSAGGLGAALKTAGAAVASLAIGVVGIGAGVTKMVMDTAKFADGLDEMSLKTGLSTERLQELNYVAGQVGTDTDTITGAMARLTRNMGAAADQQDAFNEGLAAYDAKLTKNLPKMGEMDQAFAGLGVNVRDASGKLRDNEAVFADVLAALGQIPNEAERDAKSMEIFGKSAQELNPLIKAGAAEIAKLSKEAHAMGAVLSKEDVQAAAEFSDQLASLQAGLKGTVMQVSTAFLPGLSAIATKGGGYLKSFAGIVKSAGGDLSKLTTGVAGLVQQIVTDIAAQAPKLLAGGLSIVQGITQAIVQSIPVLLPAVISMLTTLIQFIIQNIPLLLEAAVQILVGLANGITTALPQLIPAIVQIIPQIVTTLIENLPLLIDASLQLIIALATGLVNSIPALVAQVPKIVTSMVDTLIQTAPKVLTAAVELIKTLVKGLIDSLPQIGQAAGQIIQTLVQGITGLVSKLWEVGRNLVEGIWTGIQNQAAYFRQQVEGFFKGIVDGIKGILGIKSPSKVFAGIGENMAAGMGVGFKDQFRQVERNINRAVDGMQVKGINIGDSKGSMGANGSNRMISLGGIHIIVNGGGDPARVARAAEQGVLRALRATGAA